ncbi:aminomethyltransferase family protein [Streptomyces sp. AV19]|uniref:aminomethyltransferase family protein n=1 Tax=Streptomyces sp. AV19 TaxID=2793068 RepID=UPI0018FE25A5|nr:aminomethyltransferase family protein [Streptomyces sp. AV19]MBH1937199.1 aminomethyltransferase family protein [Streptomyces sp. AV19]MDG4533472.1 aminomethyltransferase family protein [Streptomyces sp. AV19]
MTNTIDTDYRMLRTTVGVYERTDALLELTGLERAELLSRVLARDTQYVEPLTVSDSLVLTEEGLPQDIVGHIELDEATWLLAGDARLADVLRKEAADAGLAEATVTDRTGAYEAVAFEGPLAWRMAARLTDFEVSSLVLGGVCEVQAPTGDAQALLARTGTTGEYGYVLLAPAGLGVRAWAEEAAAGLGGGPVGPAALERARLEVRHPWVPGEGLTAREAGVQWLMTAGREEPFRGGEALVSLPSPRRGTVLLASEQPLTEGAEVFAGDAKVGTVLFTTAAPEGAGQLAMGLLDQPFAVPGLELAAGAAAVRTVSSPAVVPVSWSRRIGE